MVTNKTPGYYRCIEKAKRIRSERRAAGLCTVCGTELEMGSKFKLCDACRRDGRYRYRQACKDEEKYKHKLQITAERNTRIRTERIRNHECLRCGAALDISYARRMCPECNEKYIEYQREYYLRGKKNG